MGLQPAGEVHGVVGDALDPQGECLEALGVSVRRAQMEGQDESISSFVIADNIFENSTRALIDTQHIHTN